MKYLLVIILAMLVGVLAHHRMEAEYQRGFGDALKSAYKTSPPSEQLELVCAGLWVGEQNKKWYQKNK